jgi:hypothetical protein
VVVVLDALAAGENGELRAALGDERFARLQAALREHTRAWARAVAGGAEPLEAARRDELPDLLAGHDGPVLLVAPDVPALSEHHAQAARDDLAAGVLVATAASGDGTPFLVVLARPEPALLAAVGEPFDVLAGAALQQGGELGMLRAERRLASPADARALRADPLAPAELRELLVGLD